MGCGACIGDKLVSAPVGYASALETALFWNVKKSLKPCKLIPHTHFSQIIKQLQFSSFARAKNNNIPSQASQENQTFILTEDQKLRLKWKLLLFCADSDFYEPQEYDIINLGLQHPCFAQIQKDLQRTFPEEKFFQSSQGIIIFQRVLKRIALYFPSVGYTQGINFIVGYLLVLEFSEEETFWMIVHLAMSPRFLMLGFFEDGFPLSSMYVRFLNYIFKRNLPELFNHFEELGVAAEAWVFKWFMTYYLYSFPKVVAREVWNLLMLKGGIGMIYFAFALLKELEKQLLEFQDPTEIIGFLQNLKEISIFNTFVKVKPLLQKSYSIDITPEELQAVTKQYISETAIDNFYTKFFASSTNSEKQKEVLIDWHEKLRKERINFRTNEEILIQDNGIKITRKSAIPSIVSRIKNPTREGRFRIKEEEFKKTKQKNFIQKSMKASSVIQEEEERSIIRSNISSRQSQHSKRNSKASNIIQISSISNNLQISNHSSSREDHFSRIPSEQSFYIEQTTERRRELTEKEISDGELTSRCNVSVHIRNEPTKHRFSKEEEVEIFELNNKPFKKKKEKSGGGSQRNQSTKLQLHFPGTIRNLAHKQSQKTVIEIGPSNIVMRQETIYSVDPSERSIMDVDLEASHNVYGESLDLRFRTPQTIKTHTESKSIEAE